MEVHLRVESASSCQPGSATRPPLARALAEGGKCSTTRAQKMACVAAQSSGSSNQSTELMTMRLVGRSMCSQAASADDIP